MSGVDRGEEEEVEEASSEGGLIVRVYGEF